MAAVIGTIPALTPYQPAALPLTGQELVEIASSSNATAAVSGSMLITDLVGKAPNVTPSATPSAADVISFFQASSQTPRSCTMSQWILGVGGGLFLYLNVADQTLSGGANVTSASLSTGNVTIDCGKCPLQFITNGGNFTITAPANDGSCILLVTNNASAGTITFSGFSVGGNTGDILTTTNGNKFSISIWRINGTSGYRISAHQ